MDDITRAIAIVFAAMLAGYGICIYNCAQLRKVLDLRLVPIQNPAEVDTGV